MNANGLGFVLWCTKEQLLLLSGVVKTKTKHQPQCPNDSKQVGKLA